MEVKTNDIVKEKLEKWFEKSTIITLNERNRFRDNYTGITLTCLTSYLAFSVALRNPENTTFLLDVTFSLQILILGLTILNGFYNLNINIDLMNRLHKKQIEIYDKLKQPNEVVEFGGPVFLKERQSFLIKTYGKMVLLSLFSIIVYGLLIIWCKN